MALVPVITACLSNKCQTLKITDATGVYDATNNTGGWENPNIAGSAVTSASITITYPNGATQVVDVLSQIPATVTGSFTFTGITLTGYQDGITTISYSVSDGTTDYKGEIQKLFTCNVRACIDKMWVDVACQTCHGNCDLGSLVDDANLAEGLYKALCSGAACCDIACTNKILDSLKNLCSWENCNC
jgi:hypothetical protein